MWYNPFYSIVQFRVTTLRYRPKEAVPIEPNQQRHISTDGVKTTAGATGQPGAPAPKNKKKPKKRRSIIGMIFSFIGCMLCLCIMAASVGGVLLSMYIVQVTADDGETLDLDNQKNRQTSIIYDINGNEYASLSRNENRIWRELSAMPENLQNAVIAIEDKNFRTEPGINLKGTIGAALNAFTGNRIWGTNRGASTLEQQLIKNLTGDNEQDNMRKVREIFRALGLDNKYSKETILEAYLNTIPLTGIIHGMEAGSIEYFGKHVEDLTLAECATLAPSRRTRRSTTPPRTPRSSSSAATMCCMRCTPRVYHRGRVQRRQGRDCHPDRKDEHHRERDPLVQQLLVHRCPVHPAAEPAAGGPELHRRRGEGADLLRRSAHLLHR